MQRQLPSMVGTLSRSYHLLIFSRDLIHSGSPSCQTQDSTMDGQMVGTSGSVTLAHTEGSSYSTSTTVTGSSFPLSIGYFRFSQVSCSEESSISIGLSVTASLGFPDIADVSTTFSVDTTITNTLSTTYVFHSCELPPSFTRFINSLSQSNQRDQSYLEHRFASKQP